MELALPGTCWFTSLVACNLFSESTKFQNESRPLEAFTGGRMGAILQMCTRLFSSKPMSRSICG